MEGSKQRMFWEDLAKLASKNWLLKNWLHKSMMPAHCAVKRQRRRMP